MVAGRAIAAPGQTFVVPAWLFKGPPQTVEFDLHPLEPTSGTVVGLTVSEGNGIVAADNAEPWPGCTNLLLPFP